MDSPRYNDFWSQNIEVNRQNVKEGKYKGENYRYVILKKTVLYPQKTGKLSIEPLTLDVSVEVPSKRRDVFGRLMMTTTNRTVTAGKRQLMSNHCQVMEGQTIFLGLLEALSLI